MVAALLVLGAALVLAGSRALQKPHTTGHSKLFEGQIPPVGSLHNEKPLDRSDPFPMTISTRM
jgi:hypothetical protein